MKSADWSKLATEFGTPLVVISRSQLRERIIAIQTVWQKAVSFSKGGLTKPPRFYFPLKANDCIPLLLDLPGFGIGADISDERELNLATRELGIQGDNVVVTGPAKDSALLAQAVSVGACIYIENLSETRDLIEIATYSKNCVRVGIRLRLFETSKFGLNPVDRELANIVNILRSEPSLNPVAVHQHDPSVLNSRNRLKEAVLRLANFADQLGASVTSPIQIDLGGGLNLGAGDFSSVQEFANSFIEIVDEIGLGNRIVYAFEWGRAIVRECGTVLSRIIRKKHSDDEQWIFVDVGQNIFGGGHANVTCESITCVNRSNGQLHKMNLAGPLCFSSDILVLNTELPRDLQEGDLLVFEGAGAYTITTRWNGPGTNPVLLIEDTDKARPLGRLWNGEFRRASRPRPMDELFRLFFEDAVDAGAINQDPELVSGISSGVNQLSPPGCLVNLHAEEAASFEVVKAYSGPLGPEEVLVAALAYEQALAHDNPIDRASCAVVAGAAQGVRRALVYLFEKGFNRCLVLGPQYQWIYDVIEATGLFVEEILGSFDNGFIPDTESISRYLKFRPRSVVFLTVPNNPTGACPDEDWLQDVCKNVAASDGHLIIDRSSEDLPFAKWVVFSRSSEQLLKNLGAKRCTIVVSPSKSRSCPGLRLGYVIGSPNLIKELAQHQYTELLSLSRHGVSFVATDLVLRTLWWRVNKLKERLGTAIENIRRITCNPHALGIDPEHLSKMAELFEPYSEQCKERLLKVGSGIEAFRSGVGRHWLGATTLHNGFNVIAELAWKGAPNQLARGLYLSTGLRILPGSCFTLDGSPLLGRSGGTTIRLSCAAEPEALHRSGTRLAEYLDGVNS